MPVELKVAVSNPGVVHFFPLPHFFFLSFLFFPFLFFSPGFFFSAPFHHYPLQARSTTSMFKHFSSIPCVARLNFGLIEFWRTWCSSQVSANQFELSLPEF